MLRHWSWCLAAVAACGGAPAPVTRPDERTTQPVEAEPSADEPSTANLPRDLLLPNADSIAVFNVAKMFDLGLEPIGRAIFAEIVGAEWDAAQALCGFNPAGEIDQIILSADAALNGVLGAVTFRSRSPQDAIDCLLKVVPFSDNGGLAEDGPGVRIGGATLLAHGRALLISEAETIRAFVAAPAGTPPGLEDLDIEEGTLVSIALTAGVMFGVSSVQSHLRVQGDAALLDIRLAQIPPSADESAGPVERFREDVESFLEVVRPRIAGHPDAERVMEAIRGVRLDQDSSDELLARFRVDGVSRLTSLAQHGHRHHLVEQGSSELRRMASSLESTVQEKGLPDGNCAVVEVPSSVPAGRAVRVKREGMPDLSMSSCLQHWGSEVVHHRFAFRRRDFIGPARGGPKPTGPTGFELSAESDFDSDGKTGLMTLAGQVVNGQMTLEPEFRDEVLE